jgi:hypothetical protein
MTPTQSPTLASQATAELPKPEWPMVFFSYEGWNDWSLEGLPEMKADGHGTRLAFSADQMNAHYLAGVEAGRASRAQSEWQTPPASWRLLAKAAIELLCAIDAKHDTEGPPTKYSVPYGAVNQLRSALGCAEDQPATFGETK